jgi:hypothetical protein
MWELNLPIAMQVAALFCECNTQSAARFALKLTLNARAQQSTETACGD